MSSEVIHAQTMTENLPMTGADNNPVTFFEQHLRERASLYFKNLNSGNFRLSLTSSTLRPASRLYRYRLESNQWKYHVLVKVPLLRQGVLGELESMDNNRAHERPRLVPVTQPHIKSELEYSALAEIYEYFSNMNDPRFAAVRVFAFIPGLDAILMEDVALPSLNQLFFKASRFWFAFSSRNLDQSFRNAGAWLRLFHQMPKYENVRIRHIERFEFIESLKEFTRHLGNRLKNEEYFDDLGSKLEMAALRILPKSLPAGLAHGDFAMRNILIGENSQVTVFDTLAKWRAPIFEDIGYFLVGLKSAGLQVFTRGMAFSSSCIKRYEREFLRGYFQKETIPYAAIRVFEAQALLDKWSARLADSESYPRTLPLSKNDLKLYFINQYFEEMLNRMVKDIR